MTGLFLSRILDQSRTVCVDGRRLRHDAQDDDPELQTDIGQCPDCSGHGCGDELGEPVFKPEIATIGRMG